MRTSPRSTNDINAIFYANEDAIVKDIEFGIPLREISNKYDISRCSLNPARVGIPWDVKRALYTRKNGGKLTIADRGPTREQLHAILRAQVRSYNNGKTQQASEAGVSIATIYEWVDRGYIPNINTNRLDIKNRYRKMAKDACKDLSRRKARMCITCGFCLYCSAKRRMEQ